MSTGSQRTILSLTKSRSGPVGDAENSTDRRVAIGFFDLLLPSRQFTVEHKVAELGQVSLTAEFLLRLLHSVDGMAEADVAMFFDFRPSELAFVIAEAESHSYVHRENGQVWLTEAGYSLFQGSEVPQIFEVQKRSDTVGFDLVSLSPSDKENLSMFERMFSEIDVKDASLVANASKRVPNAFRKFYSELVSRKERDANIATKRALYSVDAILPGDRFSALVPVVAMASLDNPCSPEASLETWKSGHELTDRSPVVNAVATFLDGLKVSSRAEDRNAYQILLDIAPEFLKDYTRRDGLSVERFFRETSARAGELRSNRPTVGIVGPIYAIDNSARLKDAIDYGRPPAEGPPRNATWITPSHQIWGASRLLSSLIQRIAGDGFSNGPGSKTSGVPFIAITCGRPAKHLQKAFDLVLTRPDSGSIPSTLEILLVSDCAVLVQVHAPIGGLVGYPVPLGILSFDPLVVERAAAFLRDALPTSLAILGSTDNFQIGDTLASKRVTGLPIASDTADDSSNPP